MADATQYKAVVAWRSIANKVVQLTKATESTLATYRVYVSPIDRHDVGSGQVESGFYFISYMGNPYLIIAVGSGYIDVEDSFRFRKCPTSGKNGIVYKSVGDGDSPYLAPFFRFLHPTAFQKFMGIALDILWKHSSGKFPYLAYASDDIGTGFTLDPTSKLPYSATLISSTEIATPVVSDFVGLWRIGGSAQVQSDWNQATNTEPDYIKNKPTLGTISPKGYWSGTLAAYTAITTKDSNTIYFIEE